MTQNAKTQKTQMRVFVQYCNIPKVEIFAFCVIHCKYLRPNYDGTTAYHRTTAMNGCN